MTPLSERDVEQRMVRAAVGYLFERHGPAIRECVAHVREDLHGRTKQFNVVVQTILQGGTLLAQLSHDLHAKDARVVSTHTPDISRLAEGITKELLRTSP